MHAAPCPWVTAYAPAAQAKASCHSAPYAGLAGRHATRPAVLATVCLIGAWVIGATSAGPVVVGPGEPVPFNKETFSVLPWDPTYSNVFRGVVLIVDVDGNGVLDTVLVTEAMVGPTHFQHPNRASFAFAQPTSRQELESMRVVSQVYWYSGSGAPEYTLRTSVVKVLFDASPESVRRAITGDGGSP
jgi:hypothetical protein